ncbi:MBL fold metallo-hydrolase [Chungangia koreensis]|uniref:MBL fold metallo-hydrolase n=1 Tax=Chungangia koreensis TaxID=752657 RepID=A0ABV8X658_9LACT
MLQFIGCGSAFNTALGNNGAFIKKDNVLFMIDCGSSTFERLQRAKLLEGVDTVHILMTHTHPDHIGSLGDLIFYGYYVMGEFAKPSIHVYAPEKLKVREILRLMAVKDEQYGYYVGNQGEIMGIAYEAFDVPHVPELNAYAYLLEIDGERIYYSGDCSEIPSVIMDKFQSGEIDAFYQDTSKLDYPGNVHLSLNKLTELIPEELRGKVYCMHLDNQFDPEEAKGLGFNVVEAVI